METAEVTRAATEGSGRQMENPPVLTDAVDSPTDYPQSPLNIWSYGGVFNSPSAPAVQEERTRMIDELHKLQVRPGDRARVQAPRPERRSTQPSDVPNRRRRHTVRLPPRLIEQSRGREATHLGVRTSLLSSAPGSGLRGPPLVGRHGGCVRLDSVPGLVASPPQPFAVCTSCGGSEWSI